MTNFITKSATVSQQNVATISPKFVELSAITPGDDFRYRAHDDKTAVDDCAVLLTEYKEAKAKGESPKYPFPPVRIWHDGTTLVLITGFQRFAAAQKAGLDEILVEEFMGTEDEAHWLAVGDNRTHGLRLRYGDLQYCVEKALKRFSEQKPEAIAEVVGCSRAYAYRIQKELSTSTSRRNEGGQSQSFEKRLNCRIAALDKFMKEQSSQDERALIIEKMGEWVEKWESEQRIGLPVVTTTHYG